MAALYIKTEAGQQAFKARSAQLAGRLRSAFLLFDGQRSVEDVLAATQGLGVTEQDIQAMVDAGFLQHAAPALAPAQPAPKCSPVHARRRSAIGMPIRWRWS